MNKNLFAKAAWIVAGALLAGCMNAGPETEDIAIEPAVESTVQAERIAAGESLAPYGVRFYQIERSGKAVHIGLEGLNGKALGELVSIDPRGAMRLELFWGGQDYAFGIDMDIDDSPLTILSGDRSGTVFQGENGEIDGDSATRRSATADRGAAAEGTERLSFPHPCNRGTFREKA
jgi:hypothetical protein